MEGERSRDDRAKGFFEIRKISVFTKSIGSSRLWIEKLQNETGKPVEAIRTITSNKRKDVSLGKPWVRRTVQSHKMILMRTKIQFIKIPENDQECFRGCKGSLLNILWSTENEVCLIWRKIVFQTASDWIESTYSKDRQFAFYDDSEQKKESLLRLFVVALS